MNTRRKRRLLDAFLGLVEAGEVDEAYWEQVCGLLEVQYNDGNRIDDKLLRNLRGILKASQTRHERTVAVVRALNRALKELLVETLAEIVVRMTRQP